MRSKLTRALASKFLAFAFVLLGTAAAYAQNTGDDWTGVYAGGYVGITHSRPTLSTSTVYSDTGYFANSSVTAINADGTRRVSGNRFTGGGQFGYNKQFGRIVVGAEADFGAQQVSKGFTVTREYPCCSPTAYTINQEVKSDWLFTARPRVGVTAGKALIYGTGGLAVTNVKYSASFTDTYASAVESAEIDKTKAGYALGGGVEVKVSKRFSVKGEYLFSDFGKETVTSNNLTSQGGGSEELNGVIGTQTWPANVFTHSVKLQNHNFRFGVNYRF